jgi:hypothetical protein
MIDRARRLPDLINPCQLLGQGENSDMEQEMDRLASVRRDTNHCNDSCKAIHSDTNASSASQYISALFYFRAGAICKV